MRTIIYPLRRFVMTVPAPGACMADDLAQIRCEQRAYRDRATLGTVWRVHHSADGYEAWWAWAVSERAHLTRSDIDRVAAGGAREVHVPRPESSPTTDAAPTPLL